MASVRFPQMSEMRTLGAAWEVERAREGDSAAKKGQNLVKFDWNSVYCLKATYLTFKR